MPLEAQYTDTDALILNAAYLYSLAAASCAGISAPTSISTSATTSTFSPTSTSTSASSSPTPTAATLISGI